MKIPPNMTEEEVLEAIEICARGLASRFRFGYHTIEDMQQEARVLALEGLETYDPSRGKLRTFLWCHVHNRLYNNKRDNFQRPDKPCHDCPLRAYDPHLQESRSGCTAYSDLMECEWYNSWLRRNSNKRNIMSPIGIDNVRDENENSMKYHDKLADEIDLSIVIDAVDKDIPLSLRKSWIRLKTGIRLPKAEQEKLIEAILDIMEIEDGAKTG